MRQMREGWGEAPFCKEESLRKAIRKEGRVVLLYTAIYQMARLHRRFFSYGRIVHSMTNMHIEEALGSLE